jgi:hypothetical protein
MPAKSMRKESPHPIAFRLPEVARQQLDDLMARWGENQSQAIIRCIERVWTMEVADRPRDKEQKLALGSFNYTGEVPDMTSDVREMAAQTLAVAHSVDSNLELVLCPASIELRLSAKAAREFDQAVAKEKEATWLPIWKQIKAGLLSAAQLMGHQFADRLIDIPLDVVTDVTYSEGRMRVVTAKGNRLGGRIGLGVGAYKLDCDLNRPGVFDSAEAQQFVSRFEQVKPLYQQYVSQLTQVA